MTQILALDIAGNPFRWLDYDRAIRYVASGKVAWSLGDAPMVFTGGVQRITGLRSRLDLPPVIALAKSEVMVRHVRPTPLGDDNDPLFRRDRHMCAYCGGVFGKRELSRDHIHPKGRGGLDVWMNAVTACRICNQRKGCRTPEQAGLSLLYVPYEPCVFEGFLLSGRNVLADQMEYLAARLPKHSRMIAACPV